MLLTSPSFFFKLRMRDRSPCIEGHPARKANSEGSPAQVLKDVMQASGKHDWVRMWCMLAKLIASNERNTSFKYAHHCSYLRKERESPKFVNNKTESDKLLPANLM